MSNPGPSSRGEDSWEEALARNRRLFREADRLEDVAYRIIESGMNDPGVLARFSEAKALADAQRRAAFLDWLRIKRERAASFFADDACK